MIGTPILWRNINEYAQGNNYATPNCDVRNQSSQSVEGALKIQITHVGDGVRNTFWWSKWLNSFFPTVRTNSLSSLANWSFVWSLFLLFCSLVVVSPSVSFYKLMLYDENEVKRLTLITLSVSVLKLKSPKTKYGAFPYRSLWNLCKVCSRARRRFLQYTEG